MSTGDWRHTQGLAARDARRTTGASLFERLASLPSLSVLTSEGAPVGDLRDRAHALARKLREAGLEPGARVVVVLPNGPDFVVGLLACLQASVTFVPVNPSLPPEERNRRLEAIGAAAVLTPGDTLQLVPTRQGHTSSAQGAPAVILFTSGSMGSGRPVGLSEQALLHVVDTHHQVLAYAPDTRVIGYLPWSHAFGFTLELLMGLLYAGPLRSVPPDAFPGVFASTPSDFLLSVPRMLERLGDAELQRLRGGVVGGAPVRGELRKRLGKTRLRIGYGQTECGPGASLGEPGEWAHDDFLGRPVGCEMVLRDSSEEGHQELLLRGPNLAMGYVAPDRIEPLALDAGWLVTGDLAKTVDGGFVSQGRRDELFKLDNGRMVNPVPLELPYDGRILLIGSGGRAVQPLARGELPANFSLPVPHLPPRLMPDSFWSACTTPTGKVSRRRAQQLFEDS
ncbi:class I adenylate-forming enzyme family protein [Vitiosangium sp. GDMCC 1.1324]|uniref:class I adenylate-forming enzyme family protein n=1 Tax=Vitiosangium sp. (strain GDMCC 1.1324) TaxID=2138576 RepID=UPI000D36BFBD|nr:AMP-binding protein [Vitiosangium sp. GDMCC 1.1324]PTL85079.1 hypothetical protein DAT35_08555 [Vitiosangium sp. GDMCC 1.1324]